MSYGMILPFYTKNLKMEDFISFKSIFISGYNKRLLNKGYWNSARLFNKGLKEESILNKQKQREEIL